MVDVAPTDPPGDVLRRLESSPQAPSGDVEQEKVPEAVVGLGME